MSSNTEQYWRRQLAQTEAEYEQIIQGLRDEVERQQRRCCELVHEQAMQRATAAANIRDFCQQYVTSAKQQQQQRVWSGTTATRMPQSAKKDVDSVPLPVLFAFLHEYSHGLLQLLENSRKRPRPDTQLSPLHHRLRQRMLARHWRTGREDELMDEWCSGEDGNGSGVAASSMPLLSASSSPTWPAVLPRYADPEGRQQMAPASGSSSPDGGGSTYPRRSGDGTVSSGVTTTTLSADGTAVPMGKASTATDGDATHGGGGPVMAASRAVRMSLQATESAVKYRSGTSGGAWEVIIDKAVSFVTEYLASTTREFDPAAPLSQHMLRLIDRGSLRDILVERNYNELCGCFGCGNKPRGILAAGSGALSFEWHSALSSSASSAESDGGVIHEEADGLSHGAHRRGQGGAANDAAAAAQSTEDQPDADPEEIVYEEDLYTVESFRLAQRQRAILNRMQRKKVMREQRAMRAATMSDGAAAAAAVGPAPVGPGGTALAASRVLRNGLLGASFPQRFCSPECEEAYESTVMPRVSPYFAYDYPSVVGAITSLFPNLRVAVLQQLAGAETSAAGLVKPILETQQQEDGGVPTEASASGSTLKAVQVGAVYESTELNRCNPSKRMARVVHRARSADVAAKMDNASSAPLLREVLEQMHVLRHVWNNEVAPRLCGTHLPRVVDAAATIPPPTSAVAAAGHFGYAQVLTSLPPRPVLRNSLLVFDFIMNTSCAQTRRLFYAHYACHRPALQRCLSAAASPRAPTAGSLFHSVSSDIISELEKRHIKALAVAGVTDGSVGDMVFGTEDEGLRVDPVLQQQRRELLVSHLFSEDVTATLSRLLLVDYAVLSNMAWSGVWFSSMPLRLPGEQQNSCCSLLHSLQFPFAIPAVLLQAVESTPEVLGLAMVFLAAAGCCSADVWCGCMREEVAFDEVAEAIGLTRDDIAAAVRSLMLGEGV